jgi:type VI secretion system protein ImpL
MSGLTDAYNAIADVAIGVRPVEQWMVVLVVALVLVCLLIAGLIVVLAMRRRHRPLALRPTSISADSPSAFALAALFRRADHRLKDMVGSSGHRLKVPWFLMLGPPQAGKSSLLSGLAMGGEAEALGSTADECRWWFFDRGVVIDPAGRLFLESDGGRSPTRHWAEMLTLLQLYRPKRPIDGVVLALPCDTLADTSPGAAERLRRLGGSLSEMLSDLQRRLGIRPTVYVVLTRADTVSGFPELAAALPAALSDEMLGWASPYSPETPFAPDWINDAFESVRHNCDEALLEILAAQDDVQAPGRAILFPGEIEALKANLSLVLGEALRTTAYLDPAMMRGLWFTGALPQRSDEGLSVGPRVVRFVRHLFEMMVFPEFGLSRPVGRAIRTTNRRVRAVQMATLALTALLATGFTVNFFSLSRNAHVAAKVLQETIADFQTLGKDDEGTATAYKNATIHVLKRLAQLNDSSLRYAFLPASLLSDLDADVRTGIHLAYERIVMQGIQRQLNLFADQISAPRVIAHTSADAAILSPAVDEMPEYKALEQFIDQASELEINGRLYHTIPDRPDVKSVARLVRYTYQYEVPPSFFVDQTLYEEPLRGVRLVRFDPTLYALRMQDRLTALFTELVQGMYGKGRLAGRAADMSAALSAIGSRQATERQDIQTLVRLRDLIALTEAELATPLAARLRHDKAPVPAAVERVLTTVDASQFFPPKTAAAQRERLEGAHRDFRTALLTMEADGFGPLFALEGSDSGTEGRIHFSRAIKAVQSDIDALLQSEFARARAGGRSRLPAAIPAGMVPKWDVAKLDRAMELYSQWDEYNQSRNGNGSASSPGKHFVTAVGSSQLVANLGELIASALVLDPIGGGYQGAGSESAIAAEAASLRDASYDLASLIQAYGDLGAFNAQAELSALVEQQTSRLIRAVDQMTRSDMLYGGPEPDMSWWDGTAPPALRGMGVTDRVELNQYLAIQRERVALIARQYAKPVIDFILTQRGVLTRFDLPALSRWQRVLIQLDAFERKVPSNSVTQLEQFIGQVMTRLSADNCGSLLQARANEDGAADFFLAQKRRLEDSLRGRCRSLQSGSASTTVRDVLERYRADLSQRFPFNGKAPRSPSQEVSPQEADAFFRQFNTAMSQGAGDPLNFRNQDGEPGALRGFLDGLDRIRVFLNSGGGRLTEARRPTTVMPSYAVDVEFRTDRDREALGSHIIDWSMTIGDKTVTQRDTSRVLQWRFGDPVEVKLRWARNAPTKPVQTGSGNPFLAVTEQTALYRYDTGWSLLALIADLGGKAPPAALSRTVELTVPVEANADVGTDPAAARKLIAETPAAHVFLRLRLLTPGPDNRLPVVVPDFAVLPPVLPGN